MNNNPFKWRHYESYHAKTRILSYLLEDMGQAMASPSAQIEVRVKTIDGDLRDTSEAWYPGMAVERFTQPAARIRC